MLRSLFVYHLSANIRVSLPSIQNPLLWQFHKINSYNNRIVRNAQLKTRK